MSQKRDLWVTPNVDTFSLRVHNSPENAHPDEGCLIELLANSLAVLWKDWPRPMNIQVLNENTWRFSLSGVCPYEGDKSVFMVVGEPFAEAVQSATMIVAAMRCQGCLRFILGIAAREASGKWAYIAHFPLEEPDDSVDKNVPPTIAADFAESLRCLWVKSYKAAVAMCRRSVEEACRDLGASGRDLYSKIEDLATKDIITDPMRRMAHQVRLTANRKLHDKGKTKTDAEANGDDLETMSEKDADAMVTFTKEFFHHVYAIRALLEKYEGDNGNNDAADTPAS